MATVAGLIRERFSDLTEIQKLAMPKVLAGENVLILAPTGSGKSEAAWLPVMERIQEKKEGIRLLYISPLRSLGRDQYARFKWWCERLNVTHDVRTGDTTQSERSRHRAKPPQILLTTPESLQALLMGRVMRSHLSKVECVIIDEVHDILDNKRGAQLSLGLERLAQIAKFQRIAISATVADEEEAARLVFGSRDYAVAESGRGRRMKVEIENVGKHEERLEKIKKLSGFHRALIFVNTRSTAEELGSELRNLNAPIEVHHGSLSKEVRISAEDKFKAGEIKSLISTSSLELGIDIGDVDLVVQYGSPHQVFRLVQRVGRSGHTLDKTPHGVVFTLDYDDFLEAEMIKILADNRWLEPKNAERGALDVIAHQLVGLCLEKGKVELAKAHEIFSRSYAYNIGLEKLRKVALQLATEGILYYDSFEDSKNDCVGTKARAREFYYTNLSTIPKEKRYLLREVSSNRIIASLDEEFVINLQNGSSFLSKGMPWQVVDITENEIIAQPSSALDIATPEWTGEDIPVSFEVAQGVGKLRKADKKHGGEKIPDDKTIIVEAIDDVVIIHSCFGTRINEGFARIFAHNLSRVIGESVHTVSDPYRIMAKLPFALDPKHVLSAIYAIKSPRRQLESSLENSYLLKFKFIHVARLFGLLGEGATVGQRYIDAMQNSVVYEETIRNIYFRYFDVEGLEELIRKIGSKEIEIVLEKKKEAGFFGKIGIERASGKDTIGSFEPRQAMVAAIKERTIEKTVTLACVSCGAQRYFHIGGHLNDGKIKCHNCGQQAVAVVEKKDEKSEDLKHKAALIRNYGINAIIALSIYGVGARTAESVLKKLHRNEEEFYLDLLEAQKNFIKNKKYWKI